MNNMAGTSQFVLRTMELNLQCLARASFITGCVEYAARARPLKVDVPLHTS